jgi:hypothetical protein
MTDFLKIDLTVVSTVGGMFHSVGFDVLVTDWSGMKTKLMELYPTLKIREENHPRGNHSDGQWKFVWVVMTKKTPLGVVLYLGNLSEMSCPAIQLLPGEYP